MSLSDREQSRRMSFGRGVMEGLRMAGVQNPGAAMNAAKQARLESGLNTMAKKVLDAVPIKEPWTRDQVMGELRRGGMTPDRSVIDGCLANLCDCRLVKQPSPGLYIRVLARQTTAIPQEIEPVTITTINIAPEQPAPTAPAQPSATSPRDEFVIRLGNLGALLRRAADEAEAIALDVDTQLQVAAAGGDKLRQLKALLSEIGA